MKKAAAILSIFACCVLFMGSARRPAPVLPSRSFYINDYAGIVEDRHRDAMLDIANSAYEMTGAQVVVLTVDSLGGQSPGEYAQSVFESWGIGGEEETGVLMLVSKEDSEAHILVGRGLSRALPEDRAARIRDEKLVAGFAKGEYTEGIYEGFKDVVTAVFAGYGTEVSFDEDSGQGAKDIGMYAVCLGIALIIAVRGFRIGKRAQKRCVKGPVYKRNTHRRELRPDEDDYPSGFGGAVRIKVRDPEDGDLPGTAEENRTAGGRTDDERT